MYRLTLNQRIYIYYKSESKQNKNDTWKCEMHVRPVFAPNGQRLFLYFAWQTWNL